MHEYIELLRANLCGIYVETAVRDGSRALAAINAGFNKVFTYFPPETDRSANMRLAPHADKVVRLSGTPVECLIQAAKDCREPCLIWLDGTINLAKGAESLIGEIKACGYFNPRKNTILMSWAPEDDGEGVAARLEKSKVSRALALLDPHYVLRALNVKGLPPLGIAYVEKTASPRSF